MPGVCFFFFNVLKTYCKSLDWLSSTIEAIIVSITILPTTSWVGSCLGSSHPWCVFRTFSRAVFSSWTPTVWLWQRSPRSHQWGGVGTHPQQQGLLHPFSPWEAWFESDGPGFGSWLHCSLFIRLLHLCVPQFLWASLSPICKIGLLHWPCWMMVGLKWRSLFNSLVEGLLHDKCPVSGHSGGDEEGQCHLMNRKTTAGGNSLGTRPWMGKWWAGRCFCSLHPSPLLREETVKQPSLCFLGQWQSSVTKKNLGMRVSTGKERGLVFWEGGVKICCVFG